MGLMVVQRRLMFSVYSLAGEYFVIRIFSGSFKTKTWQ